MFICIRCVRDELGEFLFINIKQISLRNGVYKITGIT